jgi:hypothetical protein
MKKKPAQPASWTMRATHRPPWPPNPADPVKVAREGARGYKRGKPHPLERRA